MLDSSLFSGLRFVHIPPEKLEVVVCIDAAFAVNPDHTSQLSILAMLRNCETGHVNIIHYASVKSKRVCKSVLAAEIFALVDGFDMCYAIRDSVQRITGRDTVPLTIYTDSHSLYRLCISLSQTTSAGYK